jgi:hypothetical protein
MKTANSEDNGPRHYGGSAALIRKFIKSLFLAGLLGFEANNVNSLRKIVKK